MDINPLTTDLNVCSDPSPASNDRNFFIINSSKYNSGTILKDKDVPSRLAQSKTPNTDDILTKSVAQHG